MASKKTTSELLFERYLVSHNLFFEYEKGVEERQQQGKKTPDYQVTHQSKLLVFDVKEFEGKELIPGHHYSSKIEDDLKPIREKIGKARKQFKDFKEFPCCLVLYSHDFLLASDLRMPSMVYGAMYGDIGWTYPYDQASDTFRESSWTPHFLVNGKMLRHETGKVQNKTVSAIIVLRELNDQVGVIVYENIFAANQLPRDVFDGKFDVRFGWDGQVAKRIFAGKNILDSPHLNDDASFFIQLA